MERPLLEQPENRIGRLRRHRRRLAEQQTAANLRDYIERMGLSGFLRSAAEGDGDGEDAPE